MAISTPTDKITPAGNTANQTAYTTAAVVLDANKLYILQIVGYRTAGQAVSTVVHDAAGTPLSFSLISDGTDSAAQLNYDVAAHRVHEAWYVIPGSTTASAAITITWASAQSSAGWRLIEIASGFDATGGATTFPGVAKATGNSTAPAVTMASFAATDNLTLLLVAWGSGTSNPTQTISPTESRTELSEHNDGERSSCAAHYQNPNGGDTSIGATLSASNNWGAIGIEVAVAAAGGGTTFPLTVSGAISPSGVLIKQANKALGGAISPAAVLIKQTQRLFTAAITPVGALLKQTQRLLTAAISPTGSLIKQTQRLLTAAISPTGSLIKQAQKALAGAISPVGALIKQVNRLLTGSISPSATLTNSKVILQSLAGSISPTGNLIKQVQKILTAAISPAGALIKQVNRLLTGAISPSGALANTKVVLKSFAGAISPTGALINQVLKTLTASISPTGALIKQVQRRFTAAISPTGVVASVKQVFRTFTASITPTGTLRKQVQRALSAAISPVGELLKQVQRRFTAAVSPTGTSSHVRIVMRTFTGAITPIGNVVHELIHFINMTARRLFAATSKQQRLSDEDPESRTATRTPPED